MRNVCRVLTSWTDGSERKSSVNCFYNNGGRRELFPLQSVMNECGDCCLLSSKSDGLIKEEDFVVIDRRRLVRF